MWKFFDLLDSSSRHKYGTGLSRLGVAYASHWEVEIASEANVVSRCAISGRLLVSCPMVCTILFC